MATPNPLLQHIIKTIRYRFVKATSYAGNDFGAFIINAHTRSPNEIINHLSDLAGKSISMLREGHLNIPPQTALEYNREKERFLNRLYELEKLIGQPANNEQVAKRLLQGPVADMLTHIGQIALLSGIYGKAVPKENFYNAEI
jgi:hypothetical protein